MEIGKSSYDTQESFSHTQICQAINNSKDIKASKVNISYEHANNID